MNGVWTDIRFGLFACTAIVFAAATHAERVTEREIQGIDKRFAIASEHFGDGEVQLLTRSDTGKDSVHEIHTFHCTNRTYRQDYTGNAAPENFPIAGAQGDSFALAQKTDQAAMAAHACEEHGFPSLRMEW